MLSSSSFILILKPFCCSTSCSPRSAKSGLSFRTTRLSNCRRISRGWIKSQHCYCYLWYNPHHLVRITHETQSRSICRSRLVSLKNVYFHVLHTCLFCRNDVCISFETRPGTRTLRLFNRSTAPAQSPPADILLYCTRIPSLHN